MRWPNKLSQRLSAMCFYLLYPHIPLLWSEAAAAPVMCTAVVVTSHREYKWTTWNVSAGSNNSAAAEYKRITGGYRSWWYAAISVTQLKHGAEISNAKCSCWYESSSLLYSITLTCTLMSSEPFTQPDPGMWLLTLPHCSVAKVWTLDMGGGGGGTVRWQQSHRAGSTSLENGELS